MAKPSDESESQKLRIHSDTSFDRGSFFSSFSKYTPPKEAHIAAQKMHIRPKATDCSFAAPSALLCVFSEQVMMPSVSTTSASHFVGENLRSSSTIDQPAVISTFDCEHTWKSVTSRLANASSKKFEPTVYISAGTRHCRHDCLCSLNSVAMAANAPRSSVLEIRTSEMRIFSISVHTTSVDGRKATPVRMAEAYRVVMTRLAFCPTRLTRATHAFQLSPRSSSFASLSFASSEAAAPAETSTLVCLGLLLRLLLRLSSECCECDFGLWLLGCRGPPEDVAISGLDCERIRASDAVTIVSGGGGGGLRLFGWVD
eukprot:Rhum_TRINITY_DN19074_c0_g1::Rhum_TRINITY_DN19074_c0_g1_i1::g.169190::m.169190